MKLRQWDKALIVAMLAVVTMFGVYRCLGGEDADDGVRYGVKGDMVSGSRVYRRGEWKNTASVGDPEAFTFNEFDTTGKTVEEKYEILHQMEVWWSFMKERLPRKQPCYTIQSLYRDDLRLYSSGKYEVGITVADSKVLVVDATKVLPSELTTALTPTIETYVTGLRAKADALMQEMQSSIRNSPSSRYRRRSGCPISDFRTEADALMQEVGE